VLLVIDRREVKELARVPIDQTQAVKKDFR
jgi:hypothetical protein